MTDTESIQNIVCFPIRPWESIYMLFTLPGLIVWIWGVIWCIRRNSLLGSVIVQVVGSLEVVVGAGVAFVLGMVDIANATLASRSFEPQMFIGDSKYVAKVSLCGLLIHLVMLLITVTLVISVKRRSDKHNKSALTNR